MAGSTLGLQPTASLRAAVDEPFHQTLARPAAEAAHPGRAPILPAHLDEGRLAQVGENLRLEKELRVFASYLARVRALPPTAAHSLTP